MRIDEYTLDRAIDDVHAGRRTIAECLAEHPESRDELESLLAISLSIRPPATTTLPLAAQVRLRGAILTAIAAEDTGRSTWHQWLRSIVPVRPGIAARPIAAAVAAAVLTFGFGGAAVVASQDAIPGEPLYPVKTTVERVDLALPATPLARANKHARLAMRRVDEYARVSPTYPSRELLLASVVDHVERAADALEVGDVDRSETDEIARSLTQVVAEADRLVEQSPATPVVARGRLERGESAVQRLVARSSPTAPVTTASSPRSPEPVAVDDKPPIQTTSALPSPRSAAVDDEGRGRGQSPRRPAVASPVPVTTSPSATPIIHGLQTKLDEARKAARSGEIDRARALVDEVVKQLATPTVEQTADGDLTRLRRDVEAITREVEAVKREIGRSEAGRGPSSKPAGDGGHDRNSDRTREPGRGRDPAVNGSADPGPGNASEQRPSAPGAGAGPPFGAPGELPGRGTGPPADKVPRPDRSAPAREGDEPPRSSPPLDGMEVPTTSWAVPPSNPKKAESPSHPVAQPPRVENETGGDGKPKR